MVRIAEMRESVKIVRQALRDLPPGEIRGRQPKILRPPKGEAYARIEGPKGEIGFYMVSDGSTSPYRYKVRAPSFINLTVPRPADDRPQGRRRGGHPRQLRHRHG